MATVLKTVGLKGSTGSNPVPSSRMGVGRAVYCAGLLTRWSKGPGVQIPHSQPNENLLDTYGNLFIGLWAGDLDRELFLWF